MLSLTRLRSGAALAATLVLLAACGEQESLPTTLEPTEMQEDVALTQAAFETPEAESFAELGDYINSALAGTGGAVMVAPALPMLQGPRADLERHRTRMTEILEGGETAAAIPVTLLGKTFEWDVTTDEYVETARTGAPANGVRFVLYAVDGETFAPAEPLVERGFVEITHSASGATQTGVLAVKTVGGVTVLQYTVTATEVQSAVVYSIEGFAGTGPNQVTFSLSSGFSLATGNVTLEWTTEIPTRGLRSTVRLGLGETSTTFYGVLRRGVRKVEMAGTFNGEGNGTITVKVGNRVFATMTFTDLSVVVLNADGAPLTAEEEETLLLIFGWFESAFGAPFVLLAPLYWVLDLEA